VGQAVISVEGSILGHALHAGGAVTVEDLDADAQVRPPQMLRDHGVASGVGVIIGGYEQPWGGLGAYSTRPRPFAEDDVNYLESIAALLRRRVENAFLEMSTPILPVRQGVLLVPLIGFVDGRRAHRLVQQLLPAIQTSRARVVVLDLTGVMEMDIAVADEVLRMVEAGRLQGAMIVMSGISTGLAQTWARLSADIIGRVRIVRDLEEGITQADRLLAGEDG
jgi:anti-anti-sigma regulatory factor